MPICELVKLCKSHKGVFIWIVLVRLGALMFFVLVMVGAWVFRACEIVVRVWFVFVSLGVWVVCACERIIFHFICYKN